MHLLYFDLIVIFWIKYNLAGASLYLIQNITTQPKYNSCNILFTIKYFWHFDNSFHFDPKVKVSHCIVGTWNTQCYRHVEFYQMKMKISTALKTQHKEFDTESRLYYFTNFLVSLSYDSDGHPTIPSYQHCYDPNKIVAKHGCT